MRSELKARLLTACRENASALGSALAVLFLGLAANLLTPWPMKVLVDEVLAKGTLRGFRLDGIPLAEARALLVLPLAATSLVLVALRGFFNHLRHVRLTCFADRAADPLRTLVVERVLTAEVPALAPFALDDLRTRAVEDVDRIRDCLVEVVAVLAGELVTIVSTFLILFFVDAPFAALSSLFMALLFLLYRYLPSRMSARNERARAIEASRASQTAETVRRHAFIRAWTQERPETARLNELHSRFTEANLEKSRAEARLILVAELLMAVMTATILGYGGYRVLAGRISLGDFVLFLQYLGFLYAPIGRASSFFLVLQKSRASWRRIEEILALPAEAPRGRPQCRRARAPGIRFDGVSFAYPGGQPLFSDLTFAVAPGEIAAFTGASGAGKSTLLRLLLGFLHPTAGRILIDGIPIEALPREELRQRMAWVDQEPVLLSRTVRENLLLGSPAGAEARLPDICRRVGVDSFVRALPEGYETRLTEGGVTLSVGQRQRLTLARALLSGRPLVLLDEPSAALDLELERTLFEALRDLLGGRTVLLVTHREQPLEIADFRVEVCRPGGLKAGCSRS